MGHEHVQCGDWGLKRSSNVMTFLKAVAKRNNNEPTATAK